MNQYLVRVLLACSRVGRRYVLFMEDKQNRVDRRQFVAGVASAAVVAGAGVGCSDTQEQTADLGPAADGPLTGDGPLAADGPVSPTPDAKTTGKDSGPNSLAGRVVDVHDPKSISGKTVDEKRAAAMLATGLLELTGRASLKDAWKRLIPDFAPSMRLGIKVNCINAGAANSVPFLRALVGTLTKDLGAAAAKITVWDRTAWELKGAKVTAAALGVSTAYTEGNGAGYETKAQTVNGKQVRLSRVMTQKTDLTINCGVLKDHELAGMTGALKNMYGCIDAPGSFHSQMDKEVPGLFNLPEARKRQRVFLIEGFVAVATGGPVGPATHAPGRLLLSADPLAIDVHAVALLDELRKQKGEVPVPPQLLKWIAAAAALGLGQDKPVVSKKTIKS